jgi:hypothetical protein
VSSSAAAVRSPAGGAARPAPRRLRAVRPARHARSYAGFLAAAILVAALLAVVVGHSILAQGEVRLSSLQSQLAAAQTQHRQSALQVAQLETPARIVQSAESQGHMVQPAQVVQLPWVPLDKPLAVPAIVPVAGSGTSGSASASGSGQ